MRQAIVIAGTFAGGPVLGASGLGNNTRDTRFVERAVQDLMSTISSGVCVDEHAHDQVRARCLVIFW